MSLGVRWEVELSVWEIQGLTLERLVLRQILSERCESPRFSGRHTLAGGHEKVPSIRSPVFCMRDPHVGGAVETRALWEPVGVRVRLEEACFLILFLFRM